MNASAIRNDTLVMLPTYNEAGTVRGMHAAIRSQLPDADILFIDDSSPDGTGDILERMAAEDPKLTVLHRPGKMGIGSAHQDGIRWAYDRGYRLLITMDSDLAHSPEYLGRFVVLAEDNAVVVGSRFLREDSLAGWTEWRRLLTHLGHLLTRHLLSVSFDATCAFRAYRLDRLPRGVFALVRSRDYAFFFESLHVLTFNRFAIAEVPIHLPTRTYGSSKMRLWNVAHGVWRLLVQAWRARVRPASMTVGAESASPTDEPPNTPDAWDDYWRARAAGGNAIYQAIAGLYRRYVFRRALARRLAACFEDGAPLLHAGCGSGEVDAEVVDRYRITALDFSPLALARYRARYGDRATVLRGDLFGIPVADGAFAGVYNMGVMEHFADGEIDLLLAEFRRVLRPGGCAVLFWPPEFGLTVRVLKAVHFVLNDVLGRNVHLHPAEPSRLRSRRQIDERLRRHGFSLAGFHFGPSDLFTHAVVVARREG